MKKVELGCIQQLRSQMQPACPSTPWQYEFKDNPFFRHNVLARQKGTFFIVKIINKEIYLKRMKPKYTTDWVGSRGKKQNIRVLTQKNGSHKPSYANQIVYIRKKASISALLFLRIPDSVPFILFLNHFDCCSCYFV